MNDPILLIEHGRLTGDPELKTTKTGKQILQFTVAGNGSHKDKQTGQYVDDCQIFIRCTEWDVNRAQALQKVLCKGSEVRLETAFNYTCVTDNNGQPRVYFDARFPRITVYPPRPPKTQQPQQQNTGSPSNFDDFGNSDAWGETAF